MTFTDYFTPEGNFVKGFNAYFDEEDEMKDEIYHAIRGKIAEYPADSRLVKLFYASEFACQTHGNYSTRTLFSRS